MRRTVWLVAVVVGLALMLVACNVEMPEGPVVVVQQEGSGAETPEAAVEAEAEADEAEAAATEAPVEAEAAQAEAKPAQVEADMDNPKVYEVMNQVTMVQHHHNKDTGVDTFTCASPGLGLNGVEPDPEGPRYVGPNAGDFDYRGAVGLFAVNPDGSVFFVPQQTGGKFVDEDGVEQAQFTLEEALGFFASGEAKWISGQHGDPGRVAECDPQYPRED
jgi:hypothetical protein